MDWRSASFFMFHGDTYDAGSTYYDVDDMAQYFEHGLYALAEHGLNTVTLTWMNPIDPITGEFDSSYVAGAPGWLEGIPSPAKIVELTDIAHAHGFKVIWKPHFVANDANAGNVNEFYTPNMDVAGFLANVDAYWAMLAPIAESAGVELLIAGTEHGDYSGAAYDGEWRKIFDTIRAAYSGELTYDALGYIGRGTQSADSVTFWDALDYIGISMYLPLDDGNGPSLSNAYHTLFNNPVVDWMTTPLVDVPAMLANLSATYGKSILFTEAGGNSTVGMLAWPNRPSAAPETWEQSILFAVLIDAFSQYSWFEGISWWTNLWELGPTPGDADWESFITGFNNGFDFLSKASGDVVRGLWGEGWDGAPLEGDVFLGGEGADIVTGGPLGDLLVANLQNDTVYAGDGDDRVFGGGGADRLFGEGGNDVIFGGTSFHNLADSIDGGTGHDRAYGYLGNDTILGQDGDDTLSGGHGDDSLDGGNDDDVLIDAIGTNRLVGGAGNDRAAGQLGQNTIDGNGGADILTGGVGHDDLRGGSGNDLLIGDILPTLGAADTLTGGTGNDLLQGGLGADQFRFKPNDGDDVIAVFAPDYSSPDSSGAMAQDFLAGVDKIHLTGFGYADGAEALAQVSAVGGQAVFDDQGTTITLYGVTVSELDAGDFIIV